MVVEGFSERLGRELQPVGGDVIIVALGSVATAIWDKAEALPLDRVAGTIWDKPYRAFPTAHLFPLGRLLCVA